MAPSIVVARPASAKESRCKIDDRSGGVGAGMAQRTTTGGAGPPLSEPVGFHRALCRPLADVLGDHLELTKPRILALLAPPEPRPSVHIRQWPWTRW